MLVGAVIAGIVFIAVIDYVPLRELEDAFGGTRHAGWSVLLAGAVALASSPAVAAAALLVLMRIRAAIVRRVGARATEESWTGAFNLDEALFLAALVLGVGAGVGWGYGLVALFDRLLP